MHVDQYPCTDPCPSHPLTHLVEDAEAHCARGVDLQAASKQTDRHMVWQRMVVEEGLAVAADVLE